MDTVILEGVLTKEGDYQLFSTIREIDEYSKSFDEAKKRDYWQWIIDQIKIYEIDKTKMAEIGCKYEHTSYVFDISIIEKLEIRIKRFDKLLEQHNIVEQVESTNCKKEIMQQLQEKKYCIGTEGEYRLYGPHKQTMEYCNKHFNSLSKQVEYLAWCLKEHTVLWGHDMTETQLGISIRAEIEYREKQLKLSKIEKQNEDKLDENIKEWTDSIEDLAIDADKEAKMKKVKNAQIYREYAKKYKIKDKKSEQLVFVTKDQLKRAHDRNRNKLQTDIE